MEFLIPEGWRSNCLTGLKLPKGISYEKLHKELKNKDPQVVTKLRLAMAINGVDFNNSPGAQLSATHTKEDLEFTADAFSEALDMLRRDGEV